MAFHWRCYKFICHNLLYAPLLAYLYMPSRGHTHRSSLSLSLPPTERADRVMAVEGRGRRRRRRRTMEKGVEPNNNRPTKRRTPLHHPSFPLPPSIFRTRHILPSSFQGNNVFQLLLYYACYEVILSSVIESWKGRFDREITIG